MKIRKEMVSAAVAAVLGTAVAPQTAVADVISVQWSGFFAMLDAVGVPLGNASIPAPTIKSPGNHLQTPVTGTMTFDTVTGSGNADMAPFDWFSGSAPFEATSITLQAIGDGMGGPGTLVMTNMLFNWSGVSGIPASLVLDAAGFFGGLQGGLLNDGNLTQAEVAGFGATPASDGIYVSTSPGWTGTGNGPGGQPGYLALGPVPLATTAWNTSLAPGCTLASDNDYGDNFGGGCLGVSPSGGLPLIFDNSNPGGLPDYSANTGGDIGGTPMPDGPFETANINLDITSMIVIGIPPVPVPAAVWLFGSGLLGLIGVAKRKRNVGSDLLRAR